MGKVSNKGKNKQKQSTNLTHDVVEFCISKKLFLDFEANTSYEKFTEAKARQDMFNSEVSIRYGDERANYLNEILKLLEERECLDAFNRKDGKTTTSLKNLIIFFILKQYVYNSGNELIVKEVGDLLRGNIRQSYYSNDKGCLETLQILKTMHDTDNADFLMWSTYIKYRNAKGKWRLIEPYNHFPIPLNQIDGGCFKVVKYEEHIERNDLFDYIIFCTVALHKKLYLIYGEMLDPIYVGVVEKSRLDKYLFSGMFVIDISSIIKEIFCNVLKGTYLENSISRADRCDKEREKFYNDLRKDSGNKHKISVNATVECGIPTFMSIKFNDTNMNNYKELEKWIGDDGEISKKKGRGKYNTITVKKQRIYGDKNDIKALKEITKK